MMFTLTGTIALNVTIEYMNIKHSTRLEWIA
jgi:hypothetical protein